MSNDKESMEKVEVERRQFLIKAGAIGGLAALATLSSESSVHAQQTNQESIADVLRAWTEGLGQLLTDFNNAVRAPTIGEIIKAVENLVTGFSDLASTTISAVEDFVRTVPSFISSIVLRDILEIAVFFVQGAIQAIRDAIQAVISAGSSIAADDLAAIFRAESNLLGQVIGLISRTLRFILFP